MLGAERVGRDRRRRATSRCHPRARSNDVGEAVLGDVVARAEDERLVDLVHRLEQRLDAWLARVARSRRASLTATSGSARRRERPRGSSRRRRNAGRTSTSTTSRSSANCLARATRLTALVEQHRRAVEDELVLPADEVHVEDRHRRVGRARREHRLALVEAARVVRRRVDVDDELGAARGLRDDRARSGSTRPRRS